MHRTFQLALVFFTTMLADHLTAQQVQWLTSTPIDWLQYPTVPGNVISAADPEHVYVSRLDAIVYTYNNPMGPNTLSRQGADGSTLWTVTLGDTVQVESIASDANGHVIVGGRYFNRLLVDGDPVLSVPVGHVSEGSFLCSWDADGQLLWQQDVSGGVFDDRHVSSLALDPQGRMWVALNTFFEAEIIRLNADGTQSESRTLVDAKTIGSISFDPWGGLYVSGAAESPDITINGTTFAVTENYAFFVTRMNAAGDAQWVRTAEDITFQEPQVQADLSGHAYLLGSYYEPLTWGGIPFADPLWSTGFFLTRLDSLGNFDWGVAPPYTSGSGQFTLANGKALGVDANGNAYVLGNVAGRLDWGNGVVTGSGPNITDRSIALMSFDNTGSPHWGLQGGSTSADAMYDLSVASDGTAHFAGITSDPFTLGPFTVDPGAGRASVVARVDPELSTGVWLGSDGRDDIIACPSVFSSSFRLSAPVSNGPSTSVALIDAMGRVVERTTGLGAALGERLAPGTYTVLVRDGERVLRTRVVKE